MVITSLISYTRSILFLGETTNDLFGFLTAEPNAEVKAIHPKAMPVILTTAAEVETWLTAPATDALAL
jgi:putative SOS response-associated peptidase YedK